MTYKEYCEIMDKSNFMIDSSNPYDMKILKALEKCVEEKPTEVRTIKDYNSIKIGCCPKCMNKVFGSDNFCNKCGRALDWRED